MNNNPTRVLWFDDEWGTPREPALAPWQRALQSLPPPPAQTVSKCNCVLEFARLLHEAVDSGQTYDLLMLDVMLINEPQTNYGALGFHDEDVAPYDAGAQIAQLIRSTSFDTRRPPWLRHYLEVPLLVLSSSPGVQQLVRNKVGRSRMKKLSIVPKSLRLDASTQTTEASEDFLRAVRELLKP